MSSDLARRDRLVANWAKSLKASGVSFSTETLERVTANDLRMVDRARAEGRLLDKKRKRKAKPHTGVARPDLHAEAQATKIGGQFFARPVATLIDASPRVSLSGVNAERTLAMQRRIRHLSQRGEGRIKANETMDKGPWLYPQLAREIVMTTVAYEAGLGGYAGLNARDKYRRLRRALEDICNRSDSAVGVAWWVK